MIKFDGENHSTATQWAVAVYDTDRVYGGPEEGGWYFDTRELVAVALVSSSEEADAKVEELEGGEFKSTGNRYSVCYSGSGDYVFYVYEPGEEITHSEPSERPHYE